MTQLRQTVNQTPLEWGQILHSYSPLTITYSPREMICQADSYVAGIHLIVQGVVADTILTEKGEPRDSRILSVGDIIGVEILDGSASRLSASLCRAVTCVELLFVERSQLQKAMDDHPALQQALIGHLVNRYVSARRDPRDKASVDSRLCCLLLELGQACGVLTEGENVALPSEITPRVLGEVLCISTRQLRHARQAIHSLKLHECGIEFDTAELIGRIASHCPRTS